MSEGPDREWRLDALCGRLAAGQRDRQVGELIDRMWGLSDGDDTAADRDLRRGAVRICDMCRCKLVCFGLQDGLAAVRSKAHATVVAAWFAFHRGLPGIPWDAGSYVRSMRV